MLEQPKKTKELEKLLENFPSEIGEGILDLQKTIFEEYKKTGHIPPLKGFFTIVEDKFIIMASDFDSILPPELQNRNHYISEALGKFKKFIEERGTNLVGFIMVSEAWLKIVHKSEAGKIAQTKPISEDFEAKECFVFHIDTKDYSYNCAYEKISEGGYFVVSPEPVQEIYVNKNDIEDRKNVEYNNYNFF